MQKLIIKLTDADNGLPILIGVKSIISVKIPNGINKNSPMFGKVKIESIGAMVSTFWVNESVEEIYNLINS